MGDNHRGASTRAVHAGRQRQQPHHALTTPIVQTATYTFEDTADLCGFMEARMWGQANDREEYGRYGNPTVRDAEARLAALEGGEAALLFPSGMSAVTSVLLSILSAGTHLVLTDDSYRRTRQFCLSFLKRFGISATVVPAGDYDAFEAAIRPETRLIVSESPTNPYLRVVDLPRLVDIARRHHLRTVIDSTFATPINQRPLEFGIDLVIHSATKYLGGHNDVLAGAVIGSAALIAALRQAQGVLGGVLDPHSAFLLTRGLKTLALRVERQNENGRRVAEFLSGRPEVRRVWYPGLASHPDHRVACEQMRGFGGVVSFELEADLESTSRFVDSLRLPTIAPSLGGTESLIEQPALMSYYELTSEERHALGISDSLVRYSLGIEDADDLIEDLRQGLELVPRYEYPLRLARGQGAAVITRNGGNGRERI